MAEALTDQEVTTILHYLLSAQVRAEAENEVQRQILAHAGIIANDIADYDKMIADEERRLMDKTEGLHGWMQRISALRLPEVMREMADDQARGLQP